MDTSDPLRNWEKTIEKAVHTTKPKSTTTLSFMVAGAIATLAAAFLHRKGFSPLLKRIALLVAPTAFGLGLYLNQSVQKNAQTLEDIRATWKGKATPSLASIRQTNPELTAEQRALLIRDDLLGEHMAYLAIVTKHSDWELSKLFKDGQNPEYRDVLKQKFLYEVRMTASPIQLTENPYDFHAPSSFPNLGVTPKEYKEAFEQGLIEKGKQEFCGDSAFLDVNEAIKWNHWDSLQFVLQTNKLQPPAVSALIKGRFPLALEYVLNNRSSTCENFSTDTINNATPYDLPTIELLAKQPEFDWSNSREKKKLLLIRICESSSPEAANLVTTALSNPNVDPNCQVEVYRTTTPLLSAIRANNPASVRALVANPNLEINLGGSGGLTPLQIAITRQNKEVLAALLMAPGLQKKDEVFFAAIASANVVAVEAFLEDPTFTPSKNPLPTAIMGGAPKQEVVTLLWNSPRIDKSIIHNGQTMEALANRYNVNLSLSN